MPSLTRRRTGDPTEQRHRKEVNGSLFQPRALTASAKRVRLDEAAGKPRPLRVVDWQRDAWSYYDEVPEFKQLILWRGNQLAKLDYFPATYDPDDIEGNPIPLDDEIADMPPDVVTIASEIWGRFRSAYGGQKEVQRRLEINLEVAGEAHVIGLSPRAVEGQPGATTEWDFFVASTDELSSKTTTGGKISYRVKRSSSAKANEIIELTAEDVMFRAWQSHGRFADDPDCSARGLLGEMEHLYLLSCQGRNEAKSRFSAGLLCVPNGLSAGTQPPGNVPAAQEPEDGPEARTDPFLQELANVITAPIEDPEDNASVVPLVVRGEAAELAELRLVSLARVEDTTLDSRVEERVVRLARGLNAPPEVVQGSMQTTFANAKQIAKDKWEDYLQPRAVFMADVFTIGYLRPALLDAGVDPELVARIFVWFDASDLVEHPQLSTVALPAYDRFEITGDALRNALGFGPDDAPDAVEILVRMARTKGVLTPNVTNALLELLDESVPIPEPVAPPTEQISPPGESGGTGESTGGQAAQAGMTSGQRLADVAKLLLLAEDIADRRAGNGKARTASAKGRYTPPARLPQPRTWRGRPDLAVIAAQARRASSGRGTQAGRRLVEIDRELRNRTLIAAGAAMDRALERAGNRLRSRTASANKHILADVRPRFVAARLGKALVAEAGGEDDALAGAFDELGDQFLGWAGTAASQAIDVAYGICGGFSTTTRDALGLRMADNAEEAWGWMKDTLTNLAKGRLYDPTPSAPPLGEFDPSLNVPPGLVRQAIARAGGAAALATDSSGTGPNAWVALAGGIDPSGGLATGDLMMQTLQDEGAGKEGYIWDYGAAFRKNPFEPHLALDGLQFEGFDDDVLANTEGWPEFAYYMPGDHDGCMCDAVPIIIPPDDAGAGPGGPDDLASMTADEVAAAAEGAAAAEPAGPAPSAASYTDAELRAAKKDLAAVRAEIRDLAAATKNDALGELEKAEGGRMQWPARRDERVVDKVTGRVYYVQPGGAQAGDWDWFYNLSEGERGRLTDFWCADGATGNTPDQLAEYWRAAHGTDISDDEAIAQWLDETRRHDMGSALSRGKLPSMARFGDVDPNRLIGTPYNLNVIYGDQELAIRHIADVTFNQAADDAARVLNYRPELGPAPWQMTRDEYVKEMFSINEAGAPVELTPGDEWNPPTYSQADMARLQRFDELLPMGVVTTDEAGDLLDPGQIWDEIQSLAHIAGLG